MVSASENYTQMMCQSMGYTLCEPLKIFSKEVRRHTCYPITIGVITINISSGNNNNTFFEISSASVLGFIASLTSMIDVKRRIGSLGFNMNRSFLFVTRSSRGKQLISPWHQSVTTWLVTTWLVLYCVMILHSHHFYSFISNWCLPR